MLDKPTCNLSASTNAVGNAKAYFSHFKPVSVSTLDELGDLMLTHSLSVQLYGEAETATAKGHMVSYRKAIDNIVVHGQIVNMDIDNTEYHKDGNGEWVLNEEGKRKKFLVVNPVTLEMIQNTFKELGWGCAITESKSSKPEWPKWHISAFTVQPVPDHKQFAIEYEKLCHVLHVLQIDPALKNSTQNLTPALGKTERWIVEGEPMPFHDLSVPEEVEEAANAETTKSTVTYDAAVHNLHEEGGGEKLTPEELIDMINEHGSVRCGCHNNCSHGGDSDSGAVAYTSDKGNYIYFCNGCQEKLYLVGNPFKDESAHSFDVTPGGYTIGDAPTEAVEADEIIANIDDMIGDDTISTTDVLKEIVKVNAATEREGYIQNLHKVRKIAIGAIREELISLYKADRRETFVPVYPDYIETDTGAVYLSTLDNMKVLLQKRLKLQYHYDVIRRDVFVKDWDNLNNWKSKLRSFALSQTQRDMLPKSIMEDHFDTMMLEKDKNPLMQHIVDVKWDGKDHIKKLMKRIKSDTGTAEYRTTIMTRWLVQCVAAWDGCKNTPRKDHEPKYESVLVIGGTQGEKKTSFFGKLMPGMMRDYLMTGGLLRPDNKDSVKQLTAHGMVELGELEATFKKSAIEDLKAFLSMTHDVYRRAYGRDDEKHARRTSFCASVNTEDFLSDHTGARRFFYMRVNGTIDTTSIDMMQLWAQVWHLYVNKGMRWWLERSDATHDIQSEVNVVATDAGLVGDAIIKFRNIMSITGREDHVHKRLSATHIWFGLMGQNPNKADRSQFYTAITALAKEKEFKKYKITVSKVHGISIPGTIEFRPEEV